GGVGDVDVVDRRDAGAARRALLRVQHALDAELDRGRVERLAVVELDVVPELELPCGVVEEAPGLREVALELERLDVPPEERVEDLSIGFVCVLVTVHVPVEGRRLARLDDDDGLLLRGDIASREDDDGGEGEGPGDAPVRGGLRSRHRKPPLSKGGPWKSGRGGSGDTGRARRGARRPGG